MADGDKTVIGKQTTVTLGGVAVIAGSFFAGLSWLHSSDVGRFEQVQDDLRPVIARFDAQAEKTTELVVEMKGANRRLDDLKDAIDGTTNKLVDMARGLGDLEGRVKVLEAQRKP